MISLCLQVVLRIIHHVFSVENQIAEEYPSLLPIKTDLYLPIRKQLSNGRNRTIIQSSKDNRMLRIPIISFYHYLRCQRSHCKCERVRECYICCQYCFVVIWIYHCCFDFLVQSNGLIACFCLSDVICAGFQPLNDFFARPSTDDAYLHWVNFVSIRVSRRHLAFWIVIYFESICAVCQVSIGIASVDSYLTNNRYIFCLYFCFLNLNLIRYQPCAYLFQIFYANLLDSINAFLPNAVFH